MKKICVTRLLKVPNRSFFLFGPRGAGKSTWLREVLPNASFFDLLDSSLYLELSQNPNTLEAMLGNLPDDSWVVIDEIQKIPALLDEVHRLMETREWRFALCGSSARKLRRGGTNLLAGRAITRNLEAFSSRELGDLFDPEFSLQWGSLPLVQLDRENAPDILNAYVNTYIKEEIREEGIVRNLPPFLRFLGIAGLMNGQLVNGQNIAREASVPRSSVDMYFSILEDTLLGHFLPAYRPKLKVREQTHPKFYWFDPGVARAAAGLLFDPVDRLWKGTALETMIFHELRVYNHTQNKNRPICFYRTGSGVEIDFVIETQKRRQTSCAHVVCIEVKTADKWQRKWGNPMRSLKKAERIHVDKMIGVYTGNRTYHYDGLDVLPVVDFLKMLHQGNVFLRVEMSAEIITIGTELLTGSTINTNVSYLSEKLTYLGIEICFQTSVGDNHTHLESVLSEAIKRSEIIIVTGGLGPTVDDITKQAVSSVLKTRLILETSIVSKIERFFKDRKKEIPSNNYNQALIIRGSMIINNKTGTAPGLIIERDKNTIILLPGVPRELKQMFKDTVSKYLEKKYSKNLVIKSRTLRTFGLGESDIDEKITHITEKYSNPCIAFLAHATEVDIKITAKAGNQSIADSLIADVETKIRDCLGDYVFGADDETMEKIVAAILTLRNKTIAAAESCTGGLISNLLTNVSGSSAYFIESIIAYSNEAKISLLHVSTQTIEEFGAVSSQTASAMAKGIKELAGTDYGLSVTGIAGPTGGTSQKPVGLVYIGLAHQNGVDISEHKFFGTREIIKQKAAQTALDTIRKHLINQT